MAPVGDAAPVVGDGAEGTEEPEPCLGAEPQGEQRKDKHLMFSMSRNSIHIHGAQSQYASCQEG